MADRLTAAQTAARLGVRAETLYAYVSRGLISRERGAHGSTFDVLEVERFALTRRRSPAPRPGTDRAPGTDGSPLGVIDTDIALIEDGELWYRGLEASQLAGIPLTGSTTVGGRFDAVVRWLFERTDRPRSDASALRATDGVLTAGRVLAALPPQAPAFSVLLTIVASLAAADPERFDLAGATVARVTERLIAGLVDALPAKGSRPGSEAPLAARLWPRLTAAPATADRVRTLDAALVLLVDHDMAASTMAARAAASARAHPYAVVAAGLGALDSALHGAVSASCHQLLRDVADGGDLASTTADAARRSGSGVPGFGQMRYPDGDPRAKALLGALRSAAREDREASAALGIADTVSAYVTERTGALPSIDFALATMAFAWGMSPDAGETVFAVARSAGWCAHAADEYTRTPLRLRPTGRYVGPDPADVQHSGSNAR
ncbi:citrate synthase [Microbacterium resistens]|uniref:citrate synthase (unknown stereospecificity) n=1 Tax=Microbacterium resistens TaxID=156977 RepID=A0ABU1SA81_9MICO|nr:citrate/2-methylcitrate synthase [Microbacterium resistens]MDR6866163.1 citrate synthase [Microbacterium resistens]